jgi:hypothetical protein
MHLRVEKTRCGQPHCTYCRNAPRRRRPRDIAGLVGFGSLGAALLLATILVTVWSR